MSLLGRLLRKAASHTPFALDFNRKLKSWRLRAEARYYEKVEIDRYPLSAQHTPLKPIGSVTNREEFMLLMEDPALGQIHQIEEKLLAQARSEAFAVEGYCLPCGKKVSFLVDMRSGGRRHARGWIPNWRERLECPLCQMNNRQRLVAALVMQELSVGRAKEVYFMEQITPIFKWAATTFPQHRLVGSEYLGHEYPGGAVVNGIRHEDAEHLNFANEQLDLIISNDVFEHVPNPANAFAECARVLKPGGMLLATIPFHRDRDSSSRRARLINGQVEHILPPAFHGNPVSAGGSLVFTDFGWDLLDQMKDAGFSDATVDVYASAMNGHLGGGQLVFRAGIQPASSGIVAAPAEVRGANTGTNHDGVS